MTQREGNVRPGVVKGQWDEPSSKLGENPGWNISTAADGEERKKRDLFLVGLTFTLLSLFCCVPFLFLPVGFLPRFPPVVPMSQKSSAVVILESS